jgi:putative RNA 2'-phosphotransferase
VSFGKENADYYAIEIRKPLLSAVYNLKILAKTIVYIAYQAPAEYGLFWDLDGSMPWKELYWALQEDPSLRFVRESHIRELTYMGLELPFVLEENLLRLRPGLAHLPYPIVDHPPERLYFACRRKQYAHVLEQGISRSHRSFVPASAGKQMALCLGRRRDPEPLLVEILAARAHAAGEPIRFAGAELYLLESIAVGHLHFPLIRADQHAALTVRKRVEAKPSAPGAPLSPGSFFVDAQQFHGDASTRKGIGKGGKKGDWKRQAKKERQKRSV